MNVYIIAEAGVNHNGNVDTAIQLIDAAASAGVNAIKFQTFKSEDMACSNAQKAEYQSRIGDDSENQFEMLQKLELSHEHFHQLFKHAQVKNIDFLSTPFDHDSLDFLTNELALKTIKLSSGDITNAPLLLKVARCSDEVMLSTGMSSIDEVRAALGVLAFGFSNDDDSIPSIESFLAAYESDVGQKYLAERVRLLHCTTQYPVPFKDVNLKAMDTLASTFKLPVGYSDHSEGIHVAISAVAKGACIIEKHFTLDKFQEGPDHRASLDVSELSQLVSAVRDIEEAIGDGVKQARPSEIKNRNVARRSIVASRDICKGDIFTNENLTCKRPGNGRSPFDIWLIIGNKAEQDYIKDELI